MRSCLFWIIPCVSTCLSADAQHLDLAGLNKAFGEGVKLRLDKEDRLVADHRDGSGLFRQDMAYLTRLDTNSIAYSEEEQAIVVKCSGAFPQCIEKEIFKMNTISHTNRMNLPLQADEATRLAVVQGLRGWMAAEQRRIASAPGETRTPAKRKK